MDRGVERRVECARRGGLTILSLDRGRVSQHTCVSVCVRRVSACVGGFMQHIYVFMNMLLNRFRGRSRMHRQRLLSRKSRTSHAGWVPGALHPLHARASEMKPYFRMGGVGGARLGGEGCSSVGNTLHHRPRSSVARNVSVDSIAGHWLYSFKTMQSR